MILAITDLRDALRDIEVMLQSLHRVGSFYADDQKACDEDTIRIIDGLQYAKRLARVRGLLLKAARGSLAATEMENLEQALGRLRHWRPPNRSS